MPRHLSPGNSLQVHDFPKPDDPGHWASGQGRDRAFFRASQHRQAEAGEELAGVLLAVGPAAWPGDCLRWPGMGGCNMATRARAMAPTSAHADRTSSGTVMALPLK